MKCKSLWQALFKYIEFKEYCGSLISVPKNIYFIRNIRSKRSFHLVLYSHFHPVMIITDAECHFQPIISVADGEIYGYEVLGRTHDGQSLGPYFSDPTIPENNKLKTDRIIREKAINFCSKQKINTKLFININPSWIIESANISKKRNNAIVFHTIDLIKKYKVNPKNIVIEITEKEFNENIEIFNTYIDEYRKNGISIAIDDFYFNSFDRLLKIKPDIVKIDIRLVRLSNTLSQYRKMISYISQFSLDLGISILFEGVEKESEMINSIDSGAFLIQGFLLSKATPAFQDSLRYKNVISIHRKTSMERRINSLSASKKLELEYSEKIRRFLQKKALPEFSDFDSIFYSSLDGILVKMMNKLPKAVLKIYICNAEGYQISSNIERTKKQKININETFRFSNWGFRPYFISSIDNVQKTEKSVLSEIYIDRDTHKEVRTFVCQLEKNIFLFVDIEAEKKK